MNARSEHLDAATARWLVDHGRAFVGEATDALAAGGDALAIGTRLRSRGLAPHQAAATVSAASARRVAMAAGWPAGEWLLTPSGVEQMSHPEVSAWRARRYTDAGVAVDLGAGLGGDASALRTAAGAVVAVERDPGRAVLLHHNLGSSGVLVVQADGLEVARHVEVAVHADPARRQAGRRARRLADYLPTPAAVVAATPDALGHGITVSPALDLEDPDLPAGELEFVQHGRDLVEAMLWSGGLREPRRAATATLLPAGLSVGRDGPPVDAPVGAIGAVLLEPAPAAVRARVHEQLAVDVGAWRLAERRALLTADHAPTSPWWSAAEVEAVLPPRPAPVRAWLRAADELPLEIVLHGFDADVDNWWRALGRPTRGPQGRRLHLIRTDDGAVAVPTRPVPANSEDDIA